MIPPVHCCYAHLARRFFRRHLRPAPPVAHERAVTALPRASLGVNLSGLDAFLAAPKLLGSYIAVALRQKRSVST